MAIRVSNYRIQISASASGLSSTFNSAVGLAQNFSRRVQGALNFGLTNFFNIRTFVADIGRATSALIGIENLGEIDGLAKTADSLGVAIDQLQTYRKAADLAGVEQNKFDKAIQTSLRRISEAADGLQSSSDIFEQLNINPEDLSQLDLSSQLKTFQEAFNGITNSADRARLGLELFGREGVAIQNVFSSSAIADAEAFFDSVGGGLSRSDAAGVEQANDAIANLGDTIDIAQQKILSGVAPALTVASQIAQEFVANFRIDPRQVTEGIIQGVRFVEGFVDVLGITQRAVLSIANAWEFVGLGFDRVQQLTLNGLESIADGVETLLRSLAVASDVAGFDGLADSLRSQAQVLDTSIGVFEDRLQNSLDDIAPPEFSFAGQIQSQLESLQNIDLTPPPLNLTAAGEQFQTLEDLGTKTGDKIKKALDLRSLTANSAETIDLLNNRNLALRVDGSAEASTKIEVKNDRQNFRPLERIGSSTNRLLADVIAGIRDLRTDTEDDADDVIVEVELVC